MSQGGRAIIAGMATETWESFGHGLGVNIDRNDLLGSVITPDKKADSTFRATAESVGSPALVGSASLRILWLSLPGLPAIDNPDGCLEPLQLQSAMIDDQGYAAALANIDKVAHAPSEPGTTAAQILDRYPVASGYRLFEYADYRGRGIYVDWPVSAERGGRKHLRNIATRGDDGWYVRPPIGEDGGTPTVLMTWWALLLGLSSAARYEPRAWREALDPDRSAIATRIEELLEIAEQVVPELLLEALQPRSG